MNDEETLVSLEESRIINVNRFQVLTVDKLEAFIGGLPSSAVIDVRVDAGGGSPRDPGGTITMTAKWKRYV